MLSNNIYIVGLMGSGKTSIGKLLSKTLHSEHVDIDQEIVKKTNLTISEIFKNHGENHFRKLESSMLDNVSKRKNLIVSTGGGVILSSKNISTMQNTGSIIHLDISIKIQLLRVRNKKNRPLLDVDNIKEKLTEMKNLRDNTYKSISNYSILTDNKNKKDIVQEIINKLND